MTVHLGSTVLRGSNSLSLALRTLLSDSLGDAILTGFWYPSIIPVHARINCTESRTRSGSYRRFTFSQFGSESFLGRLSS